jgi:hypothetical protein
MVCIWYVYGMYMCMCVAHPFLVGFQHSRMLDKALHWVNSHRHITHYTTLHCTEHLVHILHILHILYPLLALVALAHTEKQRNAIQCNIRHFTNTQLSTAYCLLYHLPIPIPHFISPHHIFTYVIVYVPVPVSVPVPVHVSNQKSL